MSNLLNVIDNMLYEHIGTSDFEASLVQHILFQPEAILDEASIGDSQHLFTHLRDWDFSDDSPFLSAVRAGLLKPVMADIGDDPFAGWVRRMEQRYGKAFPILTLEHQLSFRAFESAFKDALGRDSYSPLLWPNEGAPIEERYDQVLRQVFQRAHPPIEYLDAPEHGLLTARGNDEGGQGRRQRLNNLWKETEYLRGDVLDRARELTALRGRPGISRSCIVNAIGETLGIPPTSDGSQIPRIVEISTPEGKESVFLRWITQCCHLNQANTLDTAVNFPVYSTNQDFIADNLIRSPTDADPEELEGIRLDVSLPAPIELSHIPGHLLLAIRHEYGRAYFAELEEWTTDPTSYRAERVRRALTYYTNALSRYLNPSTMLTIWLERRKKSAIETTLTATEKVFGKTLDMLPHIPLPNGMDVPIAKTIFLIPHAIQAVLWSTRYSQMRPKRLTLDLTLPSSRQSSSSS